MSLPNVLQDIKDLKANQLTGRYYTPTLNRVSTGVDTITANPLPTTWTGSDKYYTNGGYSIETSMTPSGANPLNQAFNGNLNDGFIGLATANADNSIIITLPEAIRISAFSSYIPDTEGLDSIRIEGSTNKSTWQFLTTAIAGTSTVSLRTTTLTNEGDYKYYRFRFIVNTTSNLDVREIQINRYKLYRYTNEFTILDIPDPLSINQRIMVKTPSYSNTGVVLNTLNGKSIDVLLLPNKYYELVYDGNKYLAKEVI